MEKSIESTTNNKEARINVVSVIIISLNETNSPVEKGLKDRDVLLMRNTVNIRI